MFNIELFGDGLYTLLENSVSRGAFMLDIERPGWHREISIPDLHMSSGYSCICGQVFMNDVLTRTDYEDGYEYFVTNSDAAVGFHSGDYGFRGAYFGFSYDDGFLSHEDYNYFEVNSNYFWELLAHIWIEQIRIRLDEDILLPV